MKLFFLFLFIVSGINFFDHFGFPGQSEFGWLLTPNKVGGGNDWISGPPFNSSSSSLCGQLKLGIVIISFKNFCWVLFSNIFYGLIDQVLPRIPSIHLFMSILFHLHNESILSFFLFRNFLFIIKKYYQHYYLVIQQSFLLRSLGF